MCRTARSRCGRPFWRVIRPTKTMYGRSGAMPYRRDHRGVGGGGVDVDVDPVVDDVDARGIHLRIAGQDVVAHPGADGDDRVRSAVALPLHPAGHSVAAAELLGLPRPQRLEAVRGDDVRHIVQQPGQVSAQVRVPGVRMDDVHLVRRPRRSAGRRPSSPARRSRRPAPRACGARSRRGAGGRSSARRRPPAGAADHQLVHVDSGAAVDLGGPFLGQHGDSHSGSLGRPHRSRRAVDDPAQIAIRLARGRLSPRVRVRLWQPTHRDMVPACSASCSPAVRANGCIR